MKKTIFVLVAALTALAGRAALPQPDLIAQIHFAGGDRVAADQNYSAFTNEFSSADARALRKQTADKLAPWLAGWLQAKQGAGAPDGAAKLRPLFDDLQSTEWFLEARAAAGGQPDVAIAIKLTAARAQAWQTALKPYFPAVTFTQSGNWLIFDSGTGATKAVDSLARKLATPPAGWLSVDINWPRLAQWSPELKELALPEMLFEVTAPDANFHINGKFFFPDNLSIKLDPWQFPSNTVHQPLISFSAVRGFAGWLNGQDWAQSFKLTPEANQLFTWSLKGMPLQAYAAVPVADAASALQQLDGGLEPMMAERYARGGFLSPLTLNMTNKAIALEGAPFVSAYVKEVSDAGRQFLLIGGFPNPQRSKPLPPELFQSLAKPNLVFYHWEITAERLLPQINMSQLALMLTRHSQLGADSAAYKWITGVSTTLGNTSTEITQTAADQFTFTRIAPGGLTAFEFLVLADWLEARGFPQSNLSLPPMPNRARMIHPLQPNAQPSAIMPH